MATPTTACVDMVAALLSVLQTYATANPTLLRKVYTARPSGAGEWPFAFIGARNEVQTHSEGVRTRTFSPTVVVADAYSDNEQTQGALDILQDQLSDAFTAQPHAIGYGVLEVTRIDDADISLDNGPERITWYRARTFTFQALVAEGRN